MNQTDWKKAILWWVALILKPALFLSAGVILIIALGVAQRIGWISAGAGGSGSQPVAATEEENRLYICPMMCTPPLSEPGRCPVCGMELVPASSGGGTGDGRSIQIDPASRRVANIHTVAVESVAASHQIRAIGRLSYDEGKLKTIAAYVDGRLDRLYADYTGVVVNHGDELALLYSPELYTAQTELLSAKRAAQRGQSSLYSDAVLDSRGLYENSRRKLIDLGITEQQIAKLEETGQPVTRIELVAPIHGTVVAKLASEGEYVKTGQPIYRLVDLSIVWLMLELFPTDAVGIRYGQRVEAEVQSLPGQTFTGRVAFVDPSVDPKTRTVGVRVVISNKDGRLKIGDYATATIDVPMTDFGDVNAGIYDPELSGKWISPRHPHVIEDQPGKCRECGIQLVPASELGFIAEPSASQRRLVVPRNAVLMAGHNSVVYVEAKLGQFELRHVELGPSMGDRIVLLSGVKESEHVATNGNFLIDSQMQLAGNPSLIDSNKVQSTTPVDDAPSPEVVAALAKLPEEDRVLAERQRICPVADTVLGAMGAPSKVEVNGRVVFICCDGCREPLLEDPEQYLAKLDALADDSPAGEDLPPIGPIEMIEPAARMPEMQPPSSPSPAMLEDDNAEVIAALSRLRPADRILAQEQKTCPVAGTPLGSMGTPLKVEVGATSVFICCEGCRERLLAEPAKYLAEMRKEPES